VKQKNPFLAIAIAAANNEGLTLSASQCRKLMKNDYVFSDAVNAIPGKEWERIMGFAGEIKRLKEFAKFA
jgi:hypothetical protein